MTGTVVAAAAMAALTASQAPGGSPLATPGRETGPEPYAEDDGWIPPAGPSADVYHTELPPLRAQKGATDPGGPGLEVKAQSGIPATVLAAYRRAETSLAATDPGCRLPWQLLAAIGKVESGQARGGRVDADGTTLTPILGPVLNGSGFARISDTDGGAYDGDATFDRAVGPMQFIPSTWARWGADGNDDGRSDPNNIHDAALAAGHYLCAGARDLTVKADLDRAILSYNHSTAYLRTVLAWLDFYRRGAHEVPDGRGPLPASPGPG
ncbi:lytic transglycosylase domain-containing protein, partial [Streptomyces sp. T-3]|nr:lytic transglycosylase domain-containing protein [Streptomyces sp. T-3]